MSESLLTTTPIGASPPRASPASAPLSTHDPRPIIVLDTNALLDWWVFKDPAAQPIAQAIAQGHLRWLACAQMAREWSLVWPRPCFARWSPDPALAEAAFTLATMVEAPPRGPMRSRDPDDQVFIDLALHVGARWLLSKDHALLRLARRARRDAALIIEPLQAWHAEQACDGPGLGLPA